MQNAADIYSQQQQEEKKEVAAGYVYRGWTGWRLRNSCDVLLLRLRFRLNQDCSHVPDYIVELWRASNCCATVDVQIGGKGAGHRRCGEQCAPYKFTSKLNTYIFLTVPPSLPSTK